MTRLRRAAEAFDRCQQSHRPTAFVFGVIKKFGDDRASSLAALMAYYGFLAVFPLLLVVTTVLGYVGNARLQSTVVGSTLSQFPVLGTQLGRSTAHPLHGSGLGLVLGLAGLLYGSLGVTQVAQRSMADIWNVPAATRPGFFPRLGRGLGFLCVLGAGVTATGFVSALATATGRPWPAKVALFAVGLALTLVVECAVFRILTPKSVPSRALWKGAAFAGVGYLVLLSVGAALVQHQLRHAQAVYGQFAFVLGLVGWLYLVSQVTLYGAEANVVYARHLWPRSAVQPPLTAADREVLTDIAEQERRRPEQLVDVRFATEPTKSTEAAEHGEHAEVRTTPSPSGQKALTVLVVIDRAMRRFSRQERGAPAIRKPPAGKTTVSH